MVHEEEEAPDSLAGKIRGLFEHDDADTDGTGTRERDAGGHLPADADDPPATDPKRPTDPPF